MAKHPWLTKRGDVYYLRAPVPSDIRETFGKVEVSFSLRTKDLRQANRLIHGKATEVAERFEAHRGTLDQESQRVLATLPASRLDAHELGQACDQHFQNVTDQNFDSRAAVLEQVRSDVQGFVDGKFIKHPTTSWYSTFFEELTTDQALLVCFNHQTNERLTSLEDALALGDAALGVAAAVELGLALHDKDRRRAARRLMEAEADALRAILAKDHSRYDQIISRHACASAAATQTLGGTGKSKSLTWEQLVAEWEKAHEQSGGSPKVRKEWRARLLAFAKHAGVLPSKVTDTHVRTWRDKRLAEGRSPITVSDSDIACIRVIFARAIREKLLAGPSPTEGVVVDNKNRAARKMKGFSNNEAAIILEKAKLQGESWKRWVPWLCAFTGSRVSTMMNLRAIDVKWVDGHHVVEVTKEAGPTKTDDSERQIPIHAALIGDGFLEFVADRKGKRLFFDEHPRRQQGAENPGKSRCNRLAAWVRGLEGIQVGRAHNKDPSHAWRHWLKTALRRAGVPDSVADGITGHAPRSKGAGYGEVELDAKADALAKIAVPQLRRE